MERKRTTIYLEADLLSATSEAILAA